ncbi:hypothetical protein EV182_006427, partial [Spiromyces aspiralis]
MGYQADSKIPLAIPTTEFRDDSVNFFDHLEYQQQHQYHEPPMSPEPLPLRLPSKTTSAIVMACVLLGLGVILTPFGVLIVTQVLGDT